MTKSSYKNPLWELDIDYVIDPDSFEKSWWAKNEEMKKEFSFLGDLKQTKPKREIPKEEILYRNPIVIGKSMDKHFDLSFLSNKPVEKPIEDNLMKKIFG